MAEKLKHAVVLLNLGGPDSQAAVKPFLFNLFQDRAILRVPQPFRFLLAKLISTRRAPVAAKIYAAMGGGSPILPNTQAQAEALRAALTRAGDETVQVFIAMRYWHPFTAQAVKEVQDFAPDKITILSLYPQFSTTTTESSLVEWQKLADKAGLKVPTATICCYPDLAGFVTAARELITPHLAQASGLGNPLVILSAHGIPQRVADAGDPYIAQCEAGAAAIRAALADICAPEDVILSYQSRVGPLAWVKPYTDAVIRQAGSDKRPLVVFPLAFVSDHSETLVEIGIEYQELAHESGVPFFARVDAVGTHPEFIEGLAKLVQQGQSGVTMSGNGGRFCAGGCAVCPVKGNKECCG